MPDLLSLVTFAVVFLVIFFVFLKNPHFYFIFFILFRPALDYWRGYEIVKGINIASIATVFFIGICGSGIIFMKGNLYKIKNNSFLNRFNALFILFLFLTLPSFIKTNDFMISAADFLRLLAILITVNYTALLFSISEKKIKKFITLVLASSVIPLFFGMGQFFGLLTGANFFEVSEHLRVYGTFSHPNGYARFLLLIFFLILFVLYNWKLKKRNAFFLLCVSALVIFELLNTFTRSVWISAALCLIIYTLLKNGISKKVILITLLSFVVLLGFGYIQDRFEDLVASGYGVYSSWDWRLETWGVSLEMLRKNFLLGNGLGMFEETYGAMAHNDYIRICYEIGILGLSSYLGILAFIFFFYFKRMLRNIKNDIAFDESELVILFILTALIVSFVDNFLGGTTVMIYYFSIFSIFNRSFKKQVLGYDENHR